MTLSRSPVLLARSHLARWMSCAAAKNHFEMGCARGGRRTAAAGGIAGDEQARPFSHFAFKLDLRRPRLPARIKRGAERRERETGRGIHTYSRNTVR